MKIKQSDSYSAQYSLDDEQLPDLLPESPGVYLFRDVSGHTLYVGKAKSLRKRLLSYLKPIGTQPQKTVIMLRKAKGLDLIITASEKEAFLLESNLIKKYLPRYNVVLRDDKRYPCIVMDIKTAFPRLRLARRIKRDGNLYFGPFSSAQAVRQTLNAVGKIFPLRKCKGQTVKKRLRPCINYQIRRCLGPCAYEVPGETYGEVVTKVRLFLEGKNDELITNLQSEMEIAAGNLDFERAARLRDQIQAVQKTAEKQHITSPRIGNQDIVGLACEEGLFQVVVIFARSGSIIGSQNYPIKNPGGTEEEVMESFLKQYYSTCLFIPRTILVSLPLEDAGSIARWFSQISGKKINIRHPLRGKGRRLTSMAVENARSLLHSMLGESRGDLLSELKSIMGLKEYPRMIEALDISSLGGKNAVGAIAAFSGDNRHPSRYRNYLIKTVEGVDDYGMMAEVITRRIKEGDLPDLFVLDGGRGHLETVRRLMEEKGIDPLPAFLAIAKPDSGKGEVIEKLYISGRKNPLLLARNQPLFQLLIRMRDEVHRRAISYHRKLRSKKLMESELDNITGIGPHRKKMLLTIFGDAVSVFEAGEERLAQLPGIGKVIAKRIIAGYSEKTSSSV
jgi:excinuclease ABC subunit C